MDVLPLFHKALQDIVKALNPDFAKAHPVCRHAMACKILVATGGDVCLYRHGCCLAPVAGCTSWIGWELWAAPRDAARSPG